MLQYTYKKDKGGINMARKAREVSSTGLYAVILKGADNIFKAEELQGEFLTAAERYLGDGLIGIRFFETHADMLVKESEKGISMDMKPLITSFARTYNRLEKSGGKVFADRFKSVPIESEALKMECIEYLDGGETAAPYIFGNAVKRKTPPSSNAKKTVKKTDKPKVEKEIKEIVEEEPKPKKKKQLPSWLL
jgi:hypothetical protein